MTPPASGARLRVLFYNHTGQASGAERVLLDTLAGLDRSRFEPYAACPTIGPLAPLIESLGIPLRAVNDLEARFTSSPRLLLRYLRSILSSIASLRSVIRAAAPDVLHANSVRAGIVATLATLGTRTPILWRIQDDLPNHPISTLVRWTAFLSRRSTLLAVSHATARAFAGPLPFKQRLRVLHNSVNLDRFPRKTSADNAFRRALGVPPTHTLLCAVGMITPRKGLAGLIDAFSLVARRSTEIHLAIVGAPLFHRDDLHRDALLTQVRDLGLQARVHFTGARQDIPEVLRAADLLVLNATAEPFGLVLLEAIASGTPVLATHVGGIPEIVTDHVTGFLVPPNQPEALAGRILELAADPALRARVAAAAHRQLCPRFSHQRHAAAFADFLLNRFSQQPPAPPKSLSAPPVRLNAHP